MWNHPGFVATPARVACLAVKPPDCTAKCVNPLVNQMGLEFVQKRRLVLQAYIRQGNRPSTEVSRVGVSCFMYQVIRAPGTWYLACGMSDVTLLAVFAGCDTQGTRMSTLYRHSGIYRMQGTWESCCVVWGTISRARRGHAPLLLLLNCSRGRRL